MGIGDRVRERAQNQLPDLSQGELAERVGMTADAFSRALNGGRQFAALELARLAKELNTSMYWLATGRPDPSRVLVAARHTYDHETQQHESVDWERESPGVRTVAAAYTQAFSDDSADSLPGLPRDAGDARRQLEEAGGDDFVRNFAESIEAAFAIEVVRVGDVTRSFSLEVAGHRIIAVAPTANWFFQNWSIAHELGHFVGQQLTDLREATSATARAESEANAFAAELLMPAREIRALDWSTLSPPDLAAVLWKWGVSTKSLRSRLASLQIVPSESIRELLMLTTQRVLRLHREVELGNDPIADRMERAASRRFPVGLIGAHSTAVSSGMLGAETLAWMLDVDAHQLETQLAPAADEPDLDLLAAELGIAEPDHD